MKSMIKTRSMVNHSIFSRGIKYDDMNILTWTILKKTQILNGCETFALKYIRYTMVGNNHFFVKISNNTLFLLLLDVLITPSNNS